VTDTLHRYYHTSPVFAMYGIILVVFFKEDSEETDQ
jgi:hypothetical protein